MTRSDDYRKQSISIFNCYPLLKFRDMTMNRTVSKYILAGVICTLAIATGCSSVTKQTISPFTGTPQENRICIINNPRVAHEEFIQVYTQALTDQGFKVEILDSDASVSACPLTTTYIAFWGWDLALYLSYVKFDVYMNGIKSGSAVYRLEKPGVSNKFVNASKKIEELTAHIFSEK